MVYSITCKRGSIELAYTVLVTEANSVCSLHSTYHFSNCFSKEDM